MVIFIFFDISFRSTPITDDISSPVHGHFYFDADQGGQREIFVRFLPEQSDQESEEHFAIMLEDSNPAEISQEKGFVTITVLKKVTTILLLNITFFKRLLQSYMIYLTLRNRAN